MTIKTNYDTFPELKTGMFIENEDHTLGVVAGDRIIYQNGSFDFVEDAVDTLFDSEDYILRAFGEADSFNDIKIHPEKYVVWELKTEVTLTETEIREKFGINPDAELWVVC